MHNFLSIFVGRILFLLLIGGRVVGHGLAPQTAAEDQGRIRGSIRPREVALVTAQAKKGTGQLAGTTAPE